MQKNIYGTIVWFITTLFVIYAFCLNTAAAVFTDAIKTSLNAHEPGVSIAAGTFVLGFALMQIPAGYLLDRFNARYVVSAGVLLLAIGNFAISYSNNLVFFGLANFLQGLGASFAFIAAAVLISQWFSDRAFPILFGLTQALSCTLAGVIHYYFSVALLTHSWSTIYRTLSFFGFALVILTFLIVKTPSGYTRRAGASLLKSLKAVLSNRQICLCAMAGATSFGALLAYASLWYIKIQAFYSVSNLQSMIISGMIFAGIGIGTPILGYISNLYKSRKMVVHVSLCIGAMTLLMGVYLPHYHIDTLIIVKVVSFLIGFFLSGSMLFYTMVSEISESSTRGVAISVLNTAVFLFNTIMLFVPYVFVTYLSVEFFTYLWILPFFTILSLLLLYFIKDTYPS